MVGKIYQSREGRKKGHQIGLFILYAEFGAEVFSVEVHRGCRNIEDIGHFFGGLSLLDEVGYLYLPRSQFKVGRCQIA